MEGTRQSRICRPHKISESSKVRTICVAYQKNPAGGKGSSFGRAGWGECENSELLKRGVEMVVYLLKYFW